MIIYCIRSALASLFAFLLTHPIEFGADVRGVVQAAEALRRKRSLGRAEKRGQCPECGGEMVWDSYNNTFYCDACWVDVLATVDNNERSSETKEGSSS